MTKKGFSTLGDVGYLDEEGYLYLTDRKSFMIISGGVNIYPKETEDALVMHPKVADVAVFGVPNSEMGEEVKAVIQPENMSDAGPDLEAELMATANKKSPLLNAQSLLILKRNCQDIQQESYTKDYLKISTGLKNA